MSFPRHPAPVSRGDPDQGSSGTQQGSYQSPCQATAANTFSEVDEAPQRGFEKPATACLLLQLPPNPDQGSSGTQQGSYRSPCQATAANAFSEVDEAPQRGFEKPAAACLLLQPPPNPFPEMEVFEELNASLLAPVSTGKLTIPASLRSPRRPLRASPREMMPSAARSSSSMKASRPRASLSKPQAWHSAHRSLTRQEDLPGRHRRNSEAPWKFGADSQLPGNFFDLISSSKAPAP